MWWLNIAINTRFTWVVNCVGGSVWVYVSISDTDGGGHNQLVCNNTNMWRSSQSSFFMTWLFWYMSDTVLPSAHWREWQMLKYIKCFCVGSISAFQFEGSRVNSDRRWLALSWPCLLSVCCTGNCLRNRHVLHGHPGTVWMDPGSLGGLQEERIKWTF